MGMSDNFFMTRLVQTDPFGEENQFMAAEFEGCVIGRSSESRLARSQPPPKARLKKGSIH